MDTQQAWAVTQNWYQQGREEPEITPVGIGVTLSDAFAAAALACEQFCGKSVQRLVYTPSVVEQNGHGKIALCPEGDGGEPAWLLVYYVHRFPVLDFT